VTVSVSGRYETAQKNIATSSVDSTTRRTCNPGLGARVKAAIPAWRMNGASRISAVTLRTSRSSPTV
jgi:hypothetical protein